VDVRRRRIRLAVVAAVVVVAGLLVHRAGAGFLADALYTVLIYLLVALIVPRARVIVPAAIAFGFSAAVELFQLTDVPARLADVVPASALVLGTGFQGPDLGAYAVGAGAAAAADLRFGRSTPRGAPVLDPGQRLGE
jgi:hypothetical protein